MANASTDVNSNGLREVLASLRFPAQRWQLVAEAQYWGATSAFLDELIRLPVREYRDLAEVATTMLERRRGPGTVRPSGLRATPVNRPQVRARRDERAAEVRRPMRIAG